jgi:ribosome-associated toxin RatA of RatAB toxin-antitoxin module
VTESAKASIEIDAAPVEVMAVIADFETYPLWVSQLKQVDIVEPGAAGQAAVVRFGLDAGVVDDSYTLAYDWSVPGAVSWQLVSSTTFTRLDGSYRLVELAQARTEVEYQLAIGLDLPMIGAIRRTAERVLMNTALASLKRRVEGLPPIAGR